MNVLLNIFTDLNIQKRNQLIKHELLYLVKNVIVLERSVNFLNKIKPLVKPMSYIGQVTSHATGRKLKISINIFCG